MTWPAAELDTVRRLRVLAAAMPGTAIVERVLDAPYDEVWAAIEDMERTVPAFDPMVGSLRIEQRDGERLVVRTRPPLLPVTTRFDVVLRPGWCWMQSRLYVVGMAAVPAGAGTRYAHLEGLPLRRAPRWPLEPIMRRVVRRDVDGLEAITSRFG